METNRKGVDYLLHFATKLFSWKGPKLSDLARKSFSNMKKDYKEQQAVSLDLWRCAICMAWLEESRTSLEPVAVFDLNQVS